MQREQAVAEVRLGARAQHDHGTGRAECLDLLRVHVRGVHEAPVGADVAVLEQPSHGPPPVRGEALFDFAALLGDVQVHRRVARHGRRCDPLQRFLRDRAQAVHADADMQRTAGLLRRLRMVFEKLVDMHREQALVACRLGVVEAGTFVQYRHVGQPDATVCCRRADGSEHRILPPARRRVAVQVMKFGNAGVAGGEHLAVSLAGDRSQRRAAHLVRQRVHAFTPGPEIVAPGRRALLGVACKGPLEGVAVGVAEPGDDAAESRIARLLLDAGLDRRNSAAGDGQPDRVGPAIGQQRFAGENGSHGGALEVVYTGYSMLL